MSLSFEEMADSGEPDYSKLPKPAGGAGKMISIAVGVLVLAGVGYWFLSQPAAEESAADVVVVVEEPAPEHVEAAAVEDPVLPDSVASAVEAEAVEPEPVEAETIEPETIEAETIEPETIEVETIEPGSVKAKTMEPETIEAETMEPETIEAETMEPGAL